MIEKLTRKMTIQCQDDWAEYPTYAAIPVEFVAKIDRLVEKSLSAIQDGAFSVEWSIRVPFVYIEEELDLHGELVTQQVMPKNDLTYYCTVKVYERGVDVVFGEKYGAELWVTVR